MPEVTPESPQNFFCPWSCLGRLILAALVLTALMLPLPSAADVGSENTLPNMTTNTIGMEMILVQPGTFKMGSPLNEAYRDEDEQQHQVTLSKPLWLGKTEVTQSQWKEVMGTDPAKLKGDENPVEMVSWYECLHFCNKLSGKEGLTPAYEIAGDTVTWNGSADGYRLPTEAEWEYACRAGTTEPHSGDLDEMAVYARNSGRKTRAVGTRKANAWGFHDMHGNVWEWCWDRYAKDYPTDWVVDPIGPDEGTYRIERGGSWHRNPKDLRSASRATDQPATHRNGLGFRLAKPAR